MPVTVVVGAQWGDEGKGKFVDALAEKTDITVRMNGGANAGHTIVNDQGTFALNQVPSGIIHPNVMCVLAPGVVLDAPRLLKEMRDLEAQGISVWDRLIISERCHLVLPPHIEEDRLREKRKKKRKVGTTGKGIGPAYAAQRYREGIQTGAIRDPEMLCSAITNIDAYAEWAHAHPEELNTFIEAAAQLKSLIKNTSAFLWESLDAHARILLEGAQGTLLDILHGTYPYVTSSGTCIDALAHASGIASPHIERRIGVLKAYTTRVGEGPLPTAMNESVENVIRQKGGEFGTITGRARRCGWLDLPLLYYAARLNAFTEVAVTKMDVLADIDPMTVCSEPYTEGETPKLERVDSWTASDLRAPDISALPPEIKRYLDRIAEATRAPVSMVSTGPARNQILT